MERKSLCGSITSLASGAPHPRADFLDSGRTTESALQMMESSSRVHTSSRQFKAHAATIFPQDLFVAMEEIEPCFI